jgi:hypothetical protein
MGAASFVNLARIALGIEPLAEKDAGSIGVPSWDARSVFRLVGTKGNLAPPKDTDRWCRIVNVEMNNAEPPVYPKGDNVGVVEVFHLMFRRLSFLLRLSGPPSGPSTRLSRR